MPAQQRRLKLATEDGQNRLKGARPNSPVARTSGNRGPLMSDEEWKAAIVARLAKIDTDIAVDRTRRESMDRRLAAIEDTLKWLVRLIIGAMPGGLLAFMLKGGLVLV